MTSMFQTTKIPKKMETAIFFSYLFAKCAVYPCSGQCFVVLYYAEWNTGDARLLSCYGQGGDAYFYVRNGFECVVACFDSSTGGNHVVNEKDVFASEFFRLTHAECR